MVKLNKIYTKTGDDGTTGLVGGSRVPKDCPRMEAIGDVDETNAAIGIARTLMVGSLLHDEMLARIQHDLFDLGADLATPLEKNDKALRIVAAQAERLEQEIDQMNEALAPLESFVLPGGIAAASQLHLARTITRRAERMAFALSRKEKVNPHALHYLNRLSDHLFVMARAVNDNGAADVLWKPGVNR